MILIGKYPRVNYEQHEALISFLIISNLGDLKKSVDNKFIGSFYTVVFRAMEVPAMYEFDEEIHNNTPGYKLISINGMFGNKLNWVMKSKVFRYITNQRENK